MASSEAVAQRTTRVLSPRRITALVLVALFAIFVALNTVDATVQLLFMEFTGPLWLTLLLTFVLGAGTAWLLIGRRRR